MDGTNHEPIPAGPCQNSAARDRAEILRSIAITIVMITMTIGAVILAELLSPSSTDSPVFWVDAPIV